jgi:eukaryotic-like serine/threonine-protein kinase
VGRNEPCPSDDLLSDFRRGKLEETAAASIRIHVNSCSACRFRYWNADESSAGLIDGASPDRDKNPRHNGRQVIADARPAAELTIDARGAHSAISRRLGKYEIREELGKGGMGVVYRAFHTRLGREFALKVIRPEFADNPRIVARFYREAAALGVISHPNIVAATDADEADGFHFLVMELIEGFDLDAILRHCSPLSIADASEIIRQAAVGLQAVHVKNRVHRDLKPSNLMLSRDGVVKILDLGLACFRSNGQAEEPLTDTRMVMGTADYMAPEQWCRARHVDIRADIYSLGCTMFQLLTGSVPFGGSAYAGRARKEIAHAEAARPSVRELRSGVPPALDSFIRQMMSMNPAARPQSPSEIADYIAQFANGAVLTELTRRAFSSGKNSEAFEAAHSTVLPPAHTPSMPDSKHPSVAQHSRRSRLLVSLLAAVICAGIAIATFRWVATLGDAGPPQTLAAKGEPKQNRVDGKVPFAKMEPGRWHDLLRTEPTKLSWHDPRRNHFYAHDPENRELRLDVPGMSMFSFGDAERAAYQFQVSFHQTRWVGGVGVFFGYHDDVHAGLPCRRCQLLQLAPRLNAPPAEGFVIERTRLRLEDHGNGYEIVSEDEMKSTVIPTPSERQRHMLFIEVSDQALNEVRFDGVPIPVLTDRKLNAKLTVADQRGMYGVFVRECATVVGNAQVFLFERSSP